MTGRTPLPALLALMSLLAGCANQTATDRAGRQAVESAIRSYVEASNKGDVATLASLYAEDAVLLPPDHEPIQGREAIRAFWRQGTGEGLEVTNLAVEVSGNLGYLVGQYHLPATDEEPADSGKYVMCLKRQRDGSWKVTADIWNQSSDADEDDDASPPQSIT
ncbi:MAG TPA: SgcJ/EcaC family oxidoreductase [Gemmatimonadales bacterium]|nr:SgcJ/EcaC family oxidoreductase [Gemmatimonadales bacterium]